VVFPPQGGAGGGGLVYDTVDFVEVASASEPYQVPDPPSKVTFSNDTGSGFSAAMPTDPQDGAIVQVDNTDNSNASVSFSAAGQSNDFVNGEFSTSTISASGEIEYVYDASTDSWLGGLSE